MSPGTERRSIHGNTETKTITDDDLKRLPSIAWRSGDALMTNQDTITCLQEMAEAGFLGSPVEVRLADEGGDGMVREPRADFILIVDMGEGVRLAAPAIPFRDLVPGYDLKGMAPVRHVLDAALAAVDSARSAYRAVLEGTQ